MMITEPHFTATTHNGTFTVVNPASGEHRTFRIRTQKKDARFAPGERIVSLLTGPDNEEDFTGFGFIGQDGKVRVWNRFAGTQYDRYARLIGNLEAEALRWNLEVLWSAKCRCCNRELTDPVSLREGIGPVCRDK
jgi:hypothetical protein